MTFSPLTTNAASIGKNGAFRFTTSSRPHHVPRQDSHQDRVVRAIGPGTSLQRLRTDYVDVLQFHGGDAETLQRAGLINLLMDFRAQGIIRFIGVSSSLPHLPGLINLGVFDTFQIPYSCLAPEHHDWIAKAAEAGAGIILRGGIAQGGPDAEIQRPAINDIWTQAKLDDVLPHAISRAELILRYTLAHPHCHTTIVGTCNPGHLAENIAAAASGPLPSNVYEEIRSRIAALED